VRVCMWVGGFVCMFTCQEGGRVSCSMYQGSPVMCAMLPQAKVPRIMHSHDSADVRMSLALLV